MSEFLIWITFQLSSIFIIGIPITIFIWSLRKRQRVIIKLLSNFWKISILFFISLILFIGRVNFSLLILNAATILMTITVWFWSDINSELKEYKLSDYLITLTKVWRWTITFISLSFLIQSINYLPCTYALNLDQCIKWTEPSRNLYIIMNKVFNFILGANFSEPVAKFVGLFSLFIYVLGFIQWLIIKLPQIGRNSNFSNYEND